MKFYRATKNIAAILDDIDRHEKWAVDEALKISRKIGASRTKVFTGTSIWGDQKVAGFYFRDASKANQKLLKKCKNTPDCWLPRLSSKRGKEIQKQLDELKGNHIPDLCDAIGMEQFQGFSVRRPAYAKHGKHWYVGLHDDVNPVGLTRISDMAYEKARKLDQDKKKSAA